MFFFERNCGGDPHSVKNNFIKKGPKSREGNASCLHGFRLQSLNLEMSMNQEMLQ